MVAFVSSSLVLFAGVGLIIWYSRRRPTDRPLTWGEAFVAGTFVFFLLFWAYGVVPHQWLAWADNELNWRADAKILGPGSTTLADTFPMTITKQTIRDFIVTGIYIVFLGGQIAMWMYWQNRGKKKETAVAPSAYGRPLVKPPAGG